MTDLELMHELLKRLAENRKEKNLSLNYNKIISSSAECISIENLFNRKTINFYFQDDKILGIGS